MNTFLRTFDSHLLPGLFTWQKDLESAFTAINPLFAQALGFHNPLYALGKRDEEIPCGYADYAEEFRKSDQLVITQNQAIQFIEIQEFANKEWKILSVVKAPWYDDEKVNGTMGYCVDITRAFLSLNQCLLEPLLYNKQKDEQSQFILRTEQMLSTRELETLFFLLRGLSCKKISGKLGLSKRTVEQYAENLKLKFNSRSKDDLLEKAVTLGYFNIIPKSLLNRRLVLPLHN